MLVVLGLTVGNSSDGLTGVTLVPGKAGSDSSGGVSATSRLELLEPPEEPPELPPVVPAAATTSVAESEYEDAPLADASAVSTMCAAVGALVPTGAETSSS